MSTVHPLPVVVGLLGERRVALAPADVRRLAAKVSIMMERGAGIAAGFGDVAYADAGARLADLNEVVAAAEIVVTGRPPKAPQTLRPDSPVISR